jgi:hypothetical protein
MEAPPHPMRLGDSEQAYYVEVPQRTAGRAADATPGEAGRSVPTEEAARAGGPVNVSGESFTIDHISGGDR